VDKKAEERMTKAIDHVRHELATIRTGRASAALLDGIKVPYYGNPTPLNQVAAITVPEARLLVVQPYERQLVAEVVKAIQKSDLGLNPASDGTMVGSRSHPSTRSGGRLWPSTPPRSSRTARCRCVTCGAS
jgi:ribosome recycling factor